MILININSNGVNIKIKSDKKKALEMLGKAKQIAIEKKRWFLAIIAALALIYCGILWYKFIANPKWNEKEKQAYISSKEAKNSFNQKKFDTVIAEIERRKGEYSRKTENIPDIFRLK